MKKYIYAFSTLLLTASLSFGQSPKVSKSYMTMTAPTIDGVIDPAEGWNFEAGNAITNYIKVAPHDPTCDLTTPGATVNNTATWASMWDENYLYVAMKVIDDVVTLDGGDEAEFFLSAGTSRATNCPGSWPKALILKDFQFRVKAGASSPNVDNGSTILVTSTKSVKTADGYIVEAALDWMEVDFFNQPAPAIAPGRQFLFDAGNSDEDAVGAGRYGQTMWNQCCGNRNWTANQDWGVLELAPATVSVTKGLKSVNSISLQPNPASQVETVDLIFNSTESQNLSVSLVNGMSQKVSELSKSVGIGTNTIQLNTANLNSGLYYVVISNGSSNVTKKLVVNK